MGTPPEVSSAGASTPLAALPIAELGRRLRTGGLSAVELATHCLERLERLGPQYNALVTLMRESALEDARRADAELRAGQDRGPLHGIPYGAKDLLATRGHPTTWGFRPYANRVIDADAAVVERLREAGAVLVAKLAMVEFAGGMKYDHPAQSCYLGGAVNPWHAGAWTGGSSSGSGAAVAAGLVPFAIGTETHGSITSPASFCGVTGLRPGFGRVSRRGCMALSWTLDKIGPLARTAHDAGLVLAAISGPDAEDETTLPDPFEFAPQAPLPARNGARPRLCVLRDHVGAPDQPEVQANFRAALEAMGDSVEVVEDTLPELPYHEVVMTILFAEAGAAFPQLTEDGLAAELSAPECRAVPWALTTIPAQAYVNALRWRRRMHRVLAPWLARYDAIVTPTTTKVAPPLDRTFTEYYGRYRRLNILALGNLLGWPAISLPNGVGERGLPTAFQFVGAPGSENTLLALAGHYQAHTQWHTRLPAGVE